MYYFPARRGRLYRSIWSVVNRELLVRNRYALADIEFDSAEGAHDGVFYGSPKHRQISGGYRFQQTVTWYAAAALVIRA